MAEARGFSRRFGELPEEVVKTEQSILSEAAKQGIWALLFVGLLFYVLRTNEKREERLLACLDKLGNQYEKLSQDVGEVRDNIKELNGKVKA